MIIYRLNLPETGINIRLLCQSQGLTPLQLQKLLFLNTPQSIYHWYSGKSLPRVDNLYNLSILLNTPINDILVAEPVNITLDMLDGCYQ